MFRMFLQRYLLVVGFGVALVLAVLRPPPAHACTCAFDPHQEALAAARQRATAVFTGTAVSVRGMFSQWTGGPVHVTFDVSQVWKGPPQRQLVIKTGSGGGDCGITFHTGEEYIVYAYFTQNHPLVGDGLTTNICTRTQLAADAQEDLAALGAGRAPEDDSGNSPGVTPAIVFLLAALVVLGVLVVVMTIARRRRSRSA